MTKVFIVHGLGGSPNGGWRPWLMGELAHHDIYACSLSMPTPDQPVLAEWLAELARHVERNSDDDICLVGHSLGVATVLRYLSGVAASCVAGAVLVSGPCEPTGNETVREFLEAPFDFSAIKSHVGQCVVIHGDDDPVVPFQQAEKLARELGAKLVAIRGGKHLNGSAGWHQLPECRDALYKLLGIR